MGNTIDVKQREDDVMLEITEKLIRDFQYHINFVDRSMLSFARSIDSMRASCAVLTKNTEEIVGSDDGDGKSLPGGHEAALLLQTIDEVVSDHKFIALESLSKLFTFIIGISTGYLTSESETVLSVDNYRLQNCEYTEMNVQYCDARIESLQRKIKTLSTDYQEAREWIENFNKREELYLTEKKILKKMNEDLEDDSNKIKLQLKASLNAKNEAEKNNEELRNEIKCHELNADQMKVKHTKLNEDLSKERDTAVSLKEEQASVVNKLNEKIENLNGESVCFKQQYDKKIQKLEASLKHEQKTKEEAIEKIHKLNAESMQLKQEHEKDILILETSLEQDKKTKEEMTEKIHKLNAETIDLKQRREKDIQMLKESLQQEKETNKEILEKIEKLNAESTYFKQWREEDIQMRKEYFEKELKAKDEMCEKVEKLNTDSTYFQQQQTNTIRLVEESSEQEKKTKEEVIEKLNKLNAEFISLKHQHEKEIQVRIQSLEQDKEMKAEMTEHMNKLHAESTYLKQQHEKEVHTLKEYVEQEKKTKEEISENIGKSNAKAMLLKQEHEKEIQMFKQSLEQEQKAKETVITELENTKSTLRLSDEDKKSIREKVSEFESKTERLAAVIEEKQTEIDKLEKKHATETTESLMVNKKVKEELKEERTKMEETRKHLEILVETNTNLRSELTKEKRINIALREELSEYLRTTNDQIKTIGRTATEAYHKEINTLTESLEQEKKTNVELNKELERMKEMKQRSDEEKKSVYERVNVLESDIQSLRVDAKEKQIEIGTREENNKAEMDEVLAVNKKLQQDLQENQTKIEAMRTKLELLQETNTNAVFDLTKESQRCISLTDERMSDLLIMKDEIKTVSTTLKKLYARGIHTLTEQDDPTKETDMTQQLHSKEKESTDTEFNRLEMENQTLVPDKENEIDTLEKEHNCKFKICMEEKAANVSSLKEAIEKIKQLHEDEKQNITESLEREKKEKEECLKLLKNQNDNRSHHDEDISQLNKEKDELNGEVKELRDQIKSLKIKLEIASRNIIHVQICHQSGFRSLKAEEELLNSLKTRMATENIDLRFLNCSESFIVQSNIPLLIVCTRTFSYKREKIISTAIKGLKDTQKKTALLLFHERDEKSFRKEVEQSKDSFEKLRGIFDIGYKDRIYESEINSVNIEKLMEFIKREGVRKSRDVESEV